jgi:hypothetical protein
VAAVSPLFGSIAEKKSFFCPNACALALAAQKSKFFCFFLLKMSRKIK